MKAHNYDNNDLQMYLEFRESLDRLCFPEIAKWAKEGYRKIIHDGETVGFLMVVDGYVQGIYVKPEHRRKGYARKAVFSYLKEGGDILSLHIINRNTAAIKFWNSLFELEVVDENPVDTFYKVNALRGEI